LSEEPGACCVGLVVVWWWCAWVIGVIQVVITAAQTISAKIIFFFVPSINATSLIAVSIFQFLFYTKKNQFASNINLKSHYKTILNQK